MIVFECDKFKVEKDSNGEYWTIHAGTSWIEARMIYYSEFISKIAAGELVPITTKKDDSVEEL